MSAAIADIVEELKHLPEQEREAAASYIHHLATGRRERREAMLRETAGSLPGPESAALEESIALCSRIDESNW